MTEQRDEVGKEFDPFHVIRDGVIYELQREPEGGYTISVPELQGCISSGETIDESLDMIEEAMALWLEVAREKGYDIPRRFQLSQVS